MFTRLTAARKTGSPTPLHGPASPARRRRKPAATQHQLTHNQIRAAPLLPSPLPSRLPHRWRQTTMLLSRFLCPTSCVPLASGRSRRRLGNDSPANSNSHAVYDHTLVIRNPATRNKKKTHSANKLDHFAVTVFSLGDLHFHCVNHRPL